jgi:8-amino-7-oxononanoate synthase
VIEIPIAHHDQIAEVGRILFDRGIYVTLAVYPLVPRDEVGVRVQITAANTDAEVDRLIISLTDLASRGMLQSRSRAQERAA